jgi:hypothetical protein
MQCEQECASKITEAEQTLAATRAHADAARRDADAMASAVVSDASARAQTLVSDVEVRARTIVTEAGVCVCIACLFHDLSTRSCLHCDAQRHVQWRLRVMQVSDGALSYAHSCHTCVCAVLCAPFRVVLRTQTRALHRWQPTSLARATRCSTSMSRPSSRYDVM